MSFSSPFGYFLLSHVYFTDADVLISDKATGRITTPLGNSFLCLQELIYPIVPNKI